MQGIYKIENIKNKKVYIGRSKDIEHRWTEHLYNLKNGTHHSSKLQRAYNKLKDKNVLQFSIVEEVTDDSLLAEREQYWTDYYDSFNTGYNCTEKVDNPKYALKNVKKRKKKEQLNELYEEFDFLYNHNHYIHIVGKTFEDRLLTHHYKNIYLLKTIIELLEDNYGYLQEINDLGWRVEVCFSRLDDAVMLSIKDDSKLSWLYFPWKELKNMDFKPLKRFKYYAKHFSETIRDTWNCYNSWLDTESTQAKQTYEWIEEANKEADQDRRIFDIKFIEEY